MFIRFSNGQKTLMLGSIYRNGQGGTSCRIRRMISHPDYDERSMTFDVALVELDCTVRMSDAIRTIALPQSGDNLRSDGGVNVFVSGFGVMTGGWLLYFPFL